MFNSGKVVTIDMTMVKIADSIAKSPSLSEEYTISPPRFLRLIPNPTIMKRREDRGLSEDDHSRIYCKKGKTMECRKIKKHERFGGRGNKTLECAFFLNSL